MRGISRPPSTSTAEPPRREWRRLAWIWLSLGAALLSLPIIWGSKGLNTARRGGHASRRAPDFTAFDLDGRPVRVSPGNSGRMLVCFFCGCPECTAFARHIRILLPELDTHKVRILAVIHASPYVAGEFWTTTQFPGRILIDDDGSVHRTYPVGACPNTWLIDPRGFVRYSQQDSMTIAELTARLDDWLGPTPDQG